uniref:Uncharacterized protein n=1 Tax=Peronospora matthiolae TaxID=2874970 RepID=A0AAV1VPA4_9STRA
MSFQPTSTSCSPPTTTSSNSNILQDLSLLEKKRKARLEALRDLNSALLTETLTRLRGKAQQLQDDKWMYQDVQ